MTDRAAYLLSFGAFILLLLLAHSCAHHHAAVLLCPLLSRHKLNGGACDFPELCDHGHGYRCFWAHFHRIDPESGKPAAAPHFQQPTDGDEHGEARQDSQP